MFLIENHVHRIKGLKIQRHTKEFQYINGQWTKIFKNAVLVQYCIKNYEMKINHSDAQKYIRYKNGINTSNFLYIGV